MSERVEIRTLEDILRTVTAENVDRFLIDLDEWVRASLQDWGPLEYLPVMRWADDGEPGISSIRVEWEFDVPTHKRTSDA